MVSIKCPYDKTGGIIAMSCHTKHNRNSIKPQFSGIFITENTKQDVRVKSLSSVEIH